MWIANTTARTAATIEATIVSVGEKAPSAAKNRNRMTSPTASTISVLPMFSMELHM